MRLAATTPKRKGTKFLDTTTSIPSSLLKSPTGITGLDEITGGGLPSGRPTLISGSAGCGKTMLAMEFLVRGATQLGEPGVFMMFEENAKELTANVRSLGFDLDELVEQKKIVLDHVHIERSEIEETGEYDLEGLFIRLGHAIDSIGAKRVVLDTVEALFAGLPNHAILRAELRRLFRWLKDRGITAVITGEKGEASITRYGLEEYVADCVITLDHRVAEQICTRRLRVVKYRGTAHGTNEYPFIIGERALGAANHFHSAQPQGLVGPHPHRHRASRRHARRPGRLSRQQRARLRFGGHGQKHHCPGDLADKDHSAKHRRHGAPARRRHDRRQKPDERKTMTTPATQTKQPETPTTPTTPSFELRLYVAGQTAKSLAAFANLKRICETHLAGQYRIEVIDLTKTPALAAGDQIFAVPTLVRRLPEPIKKIIGDLSNEERVLVGLDVQPVVETA